jgi:DMSO/TMAO reductase YedYZ molybdopterin-dependent catalytic subunit
VESQDSLKEPQKNQPPSPIPPSPTAFTRRSFIRILGFSGGSWLMGTSVLTLWEQATVKGQGLGALNPSNLFEPLNQSVEELLLNPQKRVPEFPVSAIEPDALIENTFRFTPRLNPATYRLTVDGEVAVPLSLDLTDWQKLPRQSMVIRHVCVEGWAAIVQWAGVPLAELARLAQPRSGVRYVYFQSADGYYESWDLASALHPQTLLADEKNGEPLPVDFGAPLRLASPVKLGYKLSKWVTRVTFVSQLDSLRKGYWEDQGYEWFAGL